MLFVIFVILLIIFCFVYKIKIKWKTFLKKGFTPVRGDFGVYCYCGKQGTGKTYSVVEYLLDNKNSIEVYCNIGGIKGINYTHFTGFKELIELKHKLDDGTLGNDPKKQLVFVYDEIFTELQKKSAINKEVMDFLCQMRKRQIIFLTTAQEWAEIPLTFRRFCRYEIDTHMYNLVFFGILLKNFKDAENMKWSNDDQEFIAPLVSNTITKTRKCIAESYDTRLRISSVSPATATTVRDESSNLTSYLEKEEQENTEIFVLPKLATDKNLRSTSSIDIYDRH